MLHSSWHIQSSHPPSRAGGQAKLMARSVISLAIVCLVIVWYTLSTFLTQWSKVCRLHACMYVPFFLICQFVFYEMMYQSLFYLTTITCYFLPLLSHVWPMLIQWRSCQLSHKVVTFVPANQNMHQSGQSEKYTSKTFHVVVELLLLFTQ